MATSIKRTKALLVFIFVLGLFLFAFGIGLAINNSKFYHNSDPVKATITKILYDDDDDKEVYVTYTYKGTTYEDIRLGTSSSSMSVGKTLTVYVSRTNPERIKDKSEIRISWLILLVLGGVCMGVGGVDLTRRTIRHIKKIKYTKRGIKIQATVSEVKVDGKVVVNGKKSSTVTLIGDINGLSQIFEVKGLFDTSGITLGNTFDVYVDQDDFEKYYVDLSFDNK